MIFFILMAFLAMSLWIVEDLKIQALILGAQFITGTISAYFEIKGK